MTRIPTPESEQNDSACSYGWPWPGNAESAIRVRTRLAAKMSSMAVSRAERRREREPRVRAVFAEPDVTAVLDLLQLLEMAWHDAFGEITPSEELIDDLLLLSDGSLHTLISCANQLDWRDWKVAAGRKRGDMPPDPNEPQTYEELVMRLRVPPESKST